MVKIPSFQRNYIWDISRASKLIESLIIGLPIPQIFLYEEARNKFLVIDGQQRLMSLYYFMKHKFPRKTKRSELRQIFDSQGKIDDSVLMSDEYFTNFNLKLSENVAQKKNKLHKLNYSNLGDAKFSFDMRPLRVVVIRQNLPSNDDSSIYEIFNRLNSGGVNLRPQEIRSSMYHSSFYEMLYRVNMNPSWRKLTGSEPPDLHMKDIEVILRSFAALLDNQSYKSSLRSFINQFSRKSKTISDEKILYLSQLFDKFVNEAAEVSEDMFMSTRGRFNISLFEAVFYAYTKNFIGDEHVHGKFDISLEKIQMIKADKEFTDASMSSAGSREKYITRLKTADEIINDKVQR